ncbi:H-NS histone family protein [Curvibacter sp. CHRR-16]|uniref:H-NS histone family protein n=1 Tax=Curvibacter sp. CHRR-16 TaxID=2835872 RepID=UPI001BDB31F1|nr:H-NS histone family protein [Curvibacter sp. CHRR-16]MBT0571113.1 H-NS histone family protein [Curvibacter sp. CHRR-16]
MPSLKELIEQKTALEQQIEIARKQELSSAISQVKALVAEYQLTPEDIFSTARAKTTGVAKGSKVAPKYRDPMTGATWTGRGIAPKWLAGKNKEEFLIK